jgi:hypothetical protein
MPLFDFVFADCGKAFEELVRSSNVVEGVLLSW